MRLFTVSQRIVKCLKDLVLENTTGGRHTYQAAKNVTVLAKCLTSTVWENSKHVSKQFERVGVTYSTALVHAGMTSFEAIGKADPRELEMIVGRPPPFGNHIRECARQMPIFKVILK